jgi:hypothetical protein
LKAQLTGRRIPHALREDGWGYREVSGLEMMDRKSKGFLPNISSLDFFNKIGREFSADRQRTEVR